MAASSKSAEKAVAERRLKDLYEHLDNGSTQMALQEADRLIKKFPKFVTARVLRALTLIRMERASEAALLLEKLDVEDAPDFDEHTLQAFTHCYKELNIPERISALYERAVKRSPSQENYSALFMNHIRCSNFKAAQATALTMNKTWPTAVHSAWGIMCVIMQAVENPDREKLFLTLAERYTQNVYKGPIPHYIGELTVMVYEKLGNFARAAKEADDAAVSRPNNPHPPSIINARIIGLYLKAENYSVVMDRCEVELKDESNIENWVLWRSYYDAAFALIDGAKEEAEKTAILERTFKTLTDAVEKYSQLRGLDMARMEFVARAGTRGIAETEKHGDMVALIVEYFKKWHSKPVCYLDLVKYLPHVGDRGMEVCDGLRSFVDDIMRKWAMEQLSLDDGAKEVTPEVLQRKEPPPCSTAEAWAIANYESVLRFYGHEIKAGKASQRERIKRIARSILHTRAVPQASATLATIAADGLYAIFRQGDRTAFYELILLLETTVRNWKEDHYGKLFLMHAYSALGLFNRMRFLAASLDIKMTQRDTLGHIGFHSGEHGGYFRPVIAHYSDLGGFYDLAEREINDCAVQAFKNGAFTQVESLMRMKRSFRDSLMAMAADVSCRWFSCLFSLEAMETVVSMFHGDANPIRNYETRFPFDKGPSDLRWEELVDNRDAALLQPIDETSVDAAEAYKTRSRDEIVDISRLRHLLMRTASHVARDHKDTASAMFADLEAHIAKCRSTYGTHDRPGWEAADHELPPNLTCTSTAHLAEWVHQPYLAPMMTLLEIGVKILSFPKTAMAEQLAALPDEETWQTMLTALTSWVEGEKAKGDDDVPNVILRMPRDIRIHSRAMQTLAYCHKLMRIIDYRMHGDLASKDKREKAAKTNACVVRIDKLIEILRKATGTLCESVTALKATLTKEDGSINEALFPSVNEEFWGTLSAGEGEWSALMLSESRDVARMITLEWAENIKELTSVAHFVLERNVGNLSIVGGKW